MIVTLDICFQPIKCIGSQTQAGDADFRFELDYWLISLCNTYTFESTKSRNFINNFINYLLLNNQSRQLGQIACQTPSFSFILNCQLHIPQWFCHNYWWKIVQWLKHSQRNLCCNHFPVSIGANLPKYNFFLCLLLSTH